VIANIINMYLRSNIKLLRKRRSRTQEEVSAYLNIKRSTYSGYENGVAEPGLDILLQFSDYFGVALDTLVRVNLSDLPDSQLRQLEDGFDVYLKGTNLRVLATTVDGENRDNIELVNERAKAGYKRGYADPEYIRELPVFQLPFLSPERKYRSFQIKGDSMLPIPDGSYVTGEFVENWEYMNNGDACIVLTKEDGLLFKIMQKDFKRKQFVLHSLNKQYEPIPILVEEVSEIWKFINYISGEMPDSLNPDQELYQIVANIQEDVKQIKKKIN
jgi:transcriptional regulator with XRE-family HTH domain